MLHRRREIRTSSYVRNIFFLAPKRLSTPNKKGEKQQFERVGHKSFQERDLELPYSSPFQFTETEISCQHGL